MTSLCFRFSRNIPYLTILDLQHVLFSDRVCKTPTNRLFTKPSTGKRYSVALHIEHILNNYVL